MSSQIYPPTSEAIKIRPPTNEPVKEKFKEYVESFYCKSFNIAMKIKMTKKKTVFKYFNRLVHDVIKVSINVFLI